MGLVTPTTFSEYATKYNVKPVNLVDRGLFTEEDFLNLREVVGYLPGKKRVLNILANLRNLPRLLKDADQLFLNQLRDIKEFSTYKAIPLKDRYPISDYINKASIISAWSPKTVLEIGTYYGWGAASIKVACPQAVVYTMNPKDTKDANNPIDESMIGSVCREKGLQVIQLWADSTRFDYTALPSIDVAYIDGNHEYTYVYKDLENLSKITTKAIVLDDYIPTKKSPRGGVRAWGPWNASVVKAVDDFVASHSGIIESAYWLENTPICVLHMKGANS